MKNLLMRFLFNEAPRPYRIRTCPDSGLAMVELQAAAQPRHQ